MFYGNLLKVIHKRADSNQQETIYFFNLVTNKKQQQNVNFS